MRAKQDPKKCFRCGAPEGVMVHYRRDGLDERVSTSWSLTDSSNPDLLIAYRPGEYVRLEGGACLRCLPVVRP